ncbi:hypothetical protein O181_009812 [Austropuccinia psidii MF-1]|uniref:HIT-type domain-containing protein n=1 Tax=Austropuccinia psidii MF-1 TaxID=1389203 RepID=A0A9Q3GKM7_9BASI|nr:hypothetical protein [Austropuccinia psidii MF-1]
MAKPDKSLCWICKAEKFKYKCPQDEVAYCSLKCFRQHKENCSSISSERFDWDSDKDQNIRTTSTPASSSKNHLSSKNLRRLTDLTWPELNQEQEAIFYDPMRRNEIKPIRKHEWEKIATLKPLRELISQEPELRCLLSKMYNEDSNSKQTPSPERKKIIKQLLQLHRSESYGVSSQEIFLFNRFANMITNLLEETRQT